MRSRMRVASKISSPRARRAGSKKEMDPKLKEYMHQARKDYIEGLNRHIPTLVPLMEDFISKRKPNKVNLKQGAEVTLPYSSKNAFARDFWNYLRGKHPLGKATPTTLDLVVTSILKQNLISLPLPFPYSYTPPDMQRSNVVASLMGKGLSVTQVAQKLGISHSAALGHVKRQRCLSLMELPKKYFFASEDVYGIASRLFAHRENRRIRHVKYLKWKVITSPKFSKSARLKSLSHSDVEAILSHMIVAGKLFEVNIHPESIKIDPAKLGKFEDGVAAWIAGGKKEPVEHFTTKFAITEKAVANYLHSSHLL